MGGGTSHFDDVIPLGTVEAFHTYTWRRASGFCPRRLYSSEGPRRPDEPVDKETPLQPVLPCWPLPPSRPQAPDDGLPVLKVSTSKVMARFIASELPA